MMPIAMLTGQLTIVIWLCKKLSSPAQISLPSFCDLPDQSLTFKRQALNALWLAILLIYINKSWQHADCSA